jgi:hypothetical protein
MPAGLRAIDRLIEYLGSAAGDRSVAVEQFAKTVVAHAPGTQVVMNSIERLREECREQTRRSTLLQLLSLKFGAVTEQEVARVEQADQAALDRYLERVLTEDSASAVLAD